MERYIDAEAFLKKIERYSLSNGTTLGKHSGVADEIIDILMAEPTADVVPKSEYDDLMEQFLIVDAECDRMEKAESKQYDDLIKAKADVAREILADIESVMYNRFSNIMLGEDIRLRIAELKKKYTEGNDEV